MSFFLSGLRLAEDRIWDAQPVDRTGMSPPLARLRL
jgi:hypothetical protein